VILRLPYFLGINLSYLLVHLDSKHVSGLVAYRRICLDWSFQPRVNKTVPANCTKKVSLFFVTWDMATVMFVFSSCLISVIVKGQRTSNPGTFCSRFIDVS